ncbi:hypothetical protein AYI69_g1058 [Smittium culicis]|uniref:Uncharacterized protein n=1 Tax=Smittium culicis TaxID=133412 RepID=A0A1R1YRD2_9FUNG|nr:hypothetical protein AYI69_g1058 [Smittium culicis]
MKLTNQLIEEIEHHTSNTENLTITFAYIAFTDFNIVDLYNGKSTPRFSLPFILSLRFEYEGDSSGPGELLIVDIGNPLWNSDLQNTSSEVPIEKSIAEFSYFYNCIPIGKMINYFTNDKIATDTDFAPYPLIKLVAPSFSSNSMLKSCFFLSTDSSLESRIIPSLNLASNMRKIRTIPKISTSDRRILEISTKYNHQLTKELNLGKENDLLLKKLEATEKDIDDLQKAWAEEKTGLEEEIGSIQNLKKDLELNIKMLGARIKDTEAQQHIEIEKNNLGSIALSEETKKLKINLIESEKKYSELSDDHSAVCKEYDLLASKYENILNLVNSSETRVNELETQLEVNSNLLQNGSKIIKDLNEKIVIYQDKISNIEKSFSSRQNDISSFEIERNSYLESIQSLKRKLLDTEFSFKNKIRALEDNRQEISNRLEYDNNEVVALEEKLQQLTRENIKNLHDLKNKTSANSDLEDRLQRLEDELSNTKRSLSMEKSRVQSLMDNNDAVADLELEKDQLERDRAGLKRQIKTLKSLLDNSEERENELRSYNESLLNKLDKEKSATNKLLLKLQNKSNDFEPYYDSIQLNRSSSFSKPSPISTNHKRGKPSSSKPSNSRSPDEPFINIVSPKSKSLSLVSSPISDSTGYELSLKTSKSLEPKYTDLASKKPRNSKINKSNGTSPILSSKHKILQPKNRNSDTDQDSDLESRPANTKNAYKKNGNGTKSLKKPLHKSPKILSRSMPESSKDNQKNNNAPTISSSNILEGLKSAPHISDLVLMEGRSSRARAKANINYGESPITKLNQKSRPVVKAAKNKNIIESSSDTSLKTVRVDIESESGSNKESNDLSKSVATKSKLRSKASSNKNASQDLSEPEVTRYQNSQKSKSNQAKAVSKAPTTRPKSKTPALKAAIKANKWLPSSEVDIDSQEMTLESGSDSNSSYIDDFYSDKDVNSDSGRFPGLLSLDSPKKAKNPKTKMISGSSNAGSIKTKKRRISVARTSKALGIDPSDFDPDSSFEAPKRRMIFDNSSFKLPPLNLPSFPKK